ncbi:MAG: transposase [Candidatus Omnitrophota bacterium]
MSRPLRIEYPGAWYHIMNRGRRREEIFLDAKDYRKIFSIIEECTRRLELEVYAYSLLPNHYHLLIRTPQGNLSRIMRHLNGVYAQDFNKRYGLEGSVFRGRFKSIVVEEESYLLALLRYIHQNPVRAQIVKKAYEHRWTSHRAFMRKQERPKWLKVKPILMRFSRYEKEAAREFDRFVQDEESRELLRRLQGENWPAILGGESFVAKMKEFCRSKEMSEEEKPHCREHFREIDLAVVVHRIKEIYGISIDELKKKRQRTISELRYAFIYIGKEIAGHTLQSIGRELGGISCAAVSQQYKRACDEIRNKEGCYNRVHELEKALNLQPKT